MKIQILFLSTLLGVLFSAMLSAASYGPPIKAFHRSDFQGERINIHADWSVNSPHDYWNDAINSLIVPRGYEAHLFEHGGFRGDYIVVRGQWSSRQDRYWYNRISSIRLVPIAHPRGHYHQGPPPSHICGPACNANCGYLPAPTITAFEHHSFGGASFTITGEWSAIYSDDFWNDRISSIYVPRGYAVILYEDAYYRGRSVVLEHSWSPYTSEDFWNDRVSSIRVVRR
ncbi:beta/gamma crystallin-related protein [Lewinella sp. LCG006]|uniref:beta/gamma crystallin-related protein n=1 Tax=Lewinella sp. LCG006 TaxID=3231911 RepID=UPI0034606D45